MDEVTIYRTWEETMADMAVGLLRAEGIRARKLADMPRSVYPVSVDGLGEIEIVVPENEAQDALDILAVRFSEGDPGLPTDEDPDLSDLDDGEPGIDPEEEEEIPPVDADEEE